MALTVACGCMALGSAFADDSTDLKVPACKITVQSGSDVKTYTTVCQISISKSLLKLTTPSDFDGQTKYIGKEVTFTADSGKTHTITLTFNADRGESKCDHHSDADHPKIICPFDKITTDTES